MFGKNACVVVLFNDNQMSIIVWGITWDSVKCGCGRRMRTADADGGRRTADGGQNKQ